MNATRFTIMRLITALLIASFALAVFTPASFASDKLSSLNFRHAMRKLWEDHVTWTRLYIVSAAADLPDKDLAAQRLLQNQTDIGNAIKPFYGAAAGDKLTALLKDHILGAADLLAAAKAGDTAKVNAASAKWYANADDIATFLSSANPKDWPLDAMKEGMKMHLDLTLAEATARLKGDYATDIKDYDTVHEHILGLADTLSKGIANQFPEKAAPATLPTTGAADGRLLNVLLVLLAGSATLTFGWSLRRVRVGSKR